MILFPVDKEWDVFMHGLKSFSDVFMSEGRLQDMDQNREEI